MVHMSRHVLTAVAVAVFSLSVLGPPVQAQDKPSAQELADLRALAEQGDASAQNNPLAQELADLRALAEQGDASAQFNLGMKYVTGEGVPQARRGSRPVVPPGHRAGTRQARRSTSALRTAPVRASRRTTWKPSGGSAWPPSRETPGRSRILGLMYLNGEGVPQDNVEAHMWFNLAASRSSGADRKRSIGARGRVAELMTPADLSEAQRRAQEWHAVHTVP